MSAPVKIHDMTPSVKKVVLSLAFLIKECSEKDYQPTQYDLIKALFLADRSHLNEWGRPVTYDNYVAMNHGPVPSLAYDLLKCDEHALKTHKLDVLPWRREPLENGKFRFLPKERMEFEEFLSPSDIEALTAAIETVRELSFPQIRELTHEDPAYIEAWNRRGVAAASKMSLGLLFDDKNFDQAELLSEYSEYVCAG